MEVKGFIMNKSSQKKNDYSASEPFALETVFMRDPLMALIKLARYKFAAKMLSKNDVVVDLGCGNGYGTYFLSKFAKQVIGIDLYANMDVVSKKMSATNVRFLGYDILDFPHPEVSQENITAVTMIDVIEHFHKADGEKVIRTYSRLLSSNGMMIIGTPSKYSEKYRSIRSKESHFYEYKPEELQELCQDYFGRTLMFSMNDEIIHTGFHKLAWYIYILAFK